MGRVVIWGAGGHAMVVADIIRLRGEHELAGFLDDTSPERAGSNFCGARILGGREQLDWLLDEGIDSVVLAFGRSTARLALAEVVRAKGYELATAVHPRAAIAAEARVGAGTVIKALAAIDPGVTIGEHVIVGSCCSVGHGTVLEDGVRISAGASLAGRISVGRATMIGAGAAIKDGIRVGAGTLIGAGAAVVHHIPDGVVAFGNPARVVRTIVPADYL